MPHPDTSRPHPTRSLLILGIAGLAFALGQTLLIPAFPDLIRELDTDASGVAWTLTGYLVAAAVFTPIMGRLGDMFGKRRLLVLALVAFCAGCVVSALTNQLEIVVAGRVLQGVGGGIFPLCFGIIRDEFPARRVARSIGLMSAIAGIGGGLGLVLGGVLIDNVSYHWIFWLGAIMAAVAVASTWLFIPESPVRTPGRVDLRGALVLGIGLVMPLLAISQAHIWGWGDARTLVLIVAGLVVLAVWVQLQRRTPEPLADISTLAKPAVLMTNLATLLVGFGMFGSFVLIPQLVEAPASVGYGFGLSASEAGLLMLPGALAMLVCGPLSGILGTRFGNKVSLTLGGALAGLGLALLAVAHDSRLAILLFNVVLSGGVGFAFAAMPNLIVDNVPSAQTGEATGFNALVRSLGASLGTQLMAAVIAGSALAGTVQPIEKGFTIAFWIGAVVAGLAALAAVLVPTTPLHPHPPVTDEIASASPLGEPAYASEAAR
jgi:EmrB/QacA subfamily drug resistance transporter